MQIVSIGNNLHEMSNPVFGEKYEKHFNMLSAEISPRVLSIKANSSRGAGDIALQNLACQTFTRPAE